MDYVSTDLLRLEWSCLPFKTNSVVSHWRPRDLQGDEMSQHYWLLIAVHRLANSN